MTADSMSIGRQPQPVMVTVTRGEREDVEYWARELIAALPALYPYVGAAQKNVYLFTPTEAERDLIVQSLCAFAAASPPNGSAR